MGWAKKASRKYMLDQIADEKASNFRGQGRIRDSRKQSREGSKATSGPEHVQCR